ncbi:MAG: arabinogalactan endo-1,4-beta-galactosidase [Muribaculaceae bacterium]|nr:arabinogalactan endo-1,4-beta-galactosidase [Muribaculaceae bacterium]
MKISRIFCLVAFAVLASMTLLSCSCSSDHNAPDNDANPSPVDPAPSALPFAKGVDMSWLTQMESEGLKFHAPGSPVDGDAMQILRDTKGVNSMRLRVWVNPADRWNGIDDVMAKARRAHALGMRLMIDFHFSDTWADPGHQSTPAAWRELDIDGLTAKVGEHVTDMLGKLKAEGITPEWVQIGNEITPGMLHPLGHIDNPANLTRLINAGNDAVKAIFPDAKVIIHLDRGEDEWRYTNLFPKLQEHGARYDMIGMSLYPDDPTDAQPDTWKEMTDKCLANIRNLHATYGKPIVICEVGMHYSRGDIAKKWLTYLRSECEKLGYVDGIFYWEPQAPAGYNSGYTKGCFIDGAPTEALDPFKD